MKILVSDPLSEKGIAKLKEAGDIQVDILTTLTKEELIEKIKDYDGLLVRSGTKVTADVIEAAEKLKVIGRAGVGVDNVDVEAATKKGIIVLNAPEGNTISTAEHTIAMMMALARQIPQAHMTLKDKRWDRKKFMGVEVNGKTLGIIGLGRIGREVAKRAKAMNMRVLGYDPYLSKDKADELGIEMVNVETIAREADFITVHTPLTKDTKGIIGPKEFSVMKDGVRIINCARGGIVDEAALYDAIKSGKVAGAALDVFENEPPLESPLLELDQVVLTPHLGASTAEAQENVAIDVAEETIKALKGLPFKNAVNMPSVRPETLAAIGPYMDLAERMGSLHAQLDGGGIKKVEVIYKGELAGQETGPLTTSLLKGMLKPILSGVVNEVNAPHLMKNRGVKVIETKDSSSEYYTSLITVKVETNEGDREISGTIFGKNEPRIVSINGYKMEVVPNGYMLVSNHVDKPGIIGRVGMLLGAEGVNIASMHVGRIEVGGKAVMVLGVDAKVSEGTLKELEKIDGIYDVKFVEL